MSRLEAINPEDATGKTKQLLNGVQAKFGMTPNLIRTFANSPAVLQAYLGFSGALAGGSLRPQLREQIALTVSQANGCDYCLAAHTAVGSRLGLSEQALLQSRQGTSSDAKVSAALRFARQIVDKKGFVSDEELARVREAGYSDGEIAEIVANVGLITFNNYFDHVAATEVDFPKAPDLVDVAL